MLLEYNGIKEYSAPEDFEETDSIELDDDYCIRCGGDWHTCKCSLVISEKTFAEFCTEWGSSEDDIYEPPETIGGLSCFDCAKQMTFNCHPLVDFCHNVLQDYEIEFGKFPKLTRCEQFVSEYGG